MVKQKIIIITGLSGSGKSTVMAAFEDADYYCVDNMPVTLLPDFLSLPLRGDVGGFAFVMDLREKGFIDRYKSTLADLEKKGWQFTILFLEAEDPILLRRYSQTRRYHPLAGKGGILEGIRAEREQMENLRSDADKIIDTSGYTVHDLKALIFSIASDTRKRVPMRINILSFGFKHGAPIDADLIMDVRFIVNPYFIPKLRHLDGRTPEIQKFVLEREESRTFLKHYSELLDFLIPLYEKEGKAYLTIAIGCTGGMHRSVTIACTLFDHLNTSDRWISLTHRDVEKKKTDPPVPAADSMALTEL